MLIITGMGRSGTSVMARFCYNMGYHVGGNWSSQVNAGMEDPVVVQINHTLEKLNQGEPTPPREKRTIRELNRLVIKDPQFTKSSVLERWLPLRNDLRFLVLLRDPRAVEKSRLASPEWFKKPESYEVINERIVWCYLLLGQYGIPHQTLTFPVFLNQYDRVWKALTEFGGLTIDKRRGRACWESLVDKKLVHHS